MKGGIIMPMIIRNNIRYTGGSGSGGNTNSVELTQAEYDELLEAGNVDDESFHYRSGKSPPQKQEGLGWMDIVEVT